MAQIGARMLVVARTVGLEETYCPTRRTCSAERDEQMLKIYSMLQNQNF